MEDVLDVYARPYNEKVPVICMDEKPFQLLADARLSIPMKVGQSKRIDNEYIRKGTGSIFAFTEPLGGWRHVDACLHRKKPDWAKQIKILIDEYYPTADKVVLVMDNLNTHNISSLYEAFDPETAQRLARRLEIHYTPKHGSWLNIAEIELSVMSKQCLTRRIPSLEILNRELGIWEQTRNKKQKGIDWQFTTSDARTKLKKLYPAILL